MTFFLIIQSIFLVQSSIMLLNWYNYKYSGLVEKLRAINAQKKSTQAFYLYNDLIYSIVYRIEGL